MVFHHEKPWISRNFEWDLCHVTGELPKHAGFDEIFRESHGTL